MFSYDINERLVVSVHSRNYEDTLNCLMHGASATYVSPSCGRNAIGTAALVGDSEILVLLLQSCEEPELEIFHQANLTVAEMDTTPDDMEKLEWEDEFIFAAREDNDETNSNATDTTDEDTSLYFYYAKTFERTGELIAQLQPTCYSGRCGSYSPNGQQDPHSIDAFMMSPLHYAAVRGQFACVRKLLEHGAPIDVYNSDGLTPLHLGIKFPEVVCVLIQHGANVNLKTINGGHSPLHMAIQNRCMPVALIVLQTNLDMNLLNDRDQTPLMCAIKCGMDELSHKLVLRGTRINFQDTEGKTALYFAVHQGNVHLAGMLLERGARRIPSHYLLHHSVSANMKKMVEVLLKHGDNLYMRNREGYTPIILAINRQLTDVLKYLLQVAKTQQQYPTHFVENIDNELLEAVQNCSSLKSFKPMARLLLTYSERSRFELYNTGKLPIVCYVPHCQMPLSRAINLHKLEIAAFLLMEGADVKQICREHVVNTLRTYRNSQQTIPFGTLLNQCGFKFPFVRFKTPPAIWCMDRISFEQHMQTISTNPLSLQSLARMSVRRKILRNLEIPTPTLKYPPTKINSTLAVMVNTLDIPKALKKFIIHYDDVCLKALRD